VKTLEEQSDLNLLHFFAGWVEQGRWDEVPKGVQRRLRELKFVDYDKDPSNKRLSNRAKRLLRGFSASSVD